MVSTVLRAVTAGVVAGGLAFGVAAAQDKPQMGVVVKIGGIPWFNAMEVGIQQRAEELGWDAWMVGPTSADPALQVRAVEDLIAQGVDAIGVVPNDAEVLEPVLARAREAGILVITHESPDQQNVDWNFEMASSVGFGVAHAQLLADKMGGAGDYALYVGSLTVPLHNAWADAATAYLEENYPDMHLVADRFGVAESVDDSRSTALDLMRAHPDLGGFLAFGSQGPIGAGRAVDERRRAGQTFVVGPFSPGQGQRLVHDGVITGGFMWNPMEAGKVFVTMADMLYDKTEITDGMEIPGLGEVHPDFENHNIIVDQLVELNADTVDALADMGL
ncbi:MAG: autoinducer 2 ABC transporter substrate-binding protein [Alphaproteobacteria bacterium]